MGRVTQITGATSDHRRQKWWSEAIGGKAMERLLDHSTPRDQARLLEQANGVGASFMIVPPSEPLQTVFSPDTYRLALRWWLGVPLIEATEAVTLCPGCQAEVDRFGDHLLCCLRNSYSTRHSAVQECLVNYLVEAGQGAEKEKAITLETGSTKLASLGRPMLVWT
jgi:hypothetical protein